MPTRNGRTPFLNSAHRVALLGREHGTPDDDGEARELRGLEAERPDLDPAPGAVDERRDAEVTGRSGMSSSTIVTSSSGHASRCQSR